MTEEEKNRTVRITNIQRFCLHDGPGVRTTVFFKGCSIRCPWCCNPENISYDLQPWRDERGAVGVYGNDITLEELFAEVSKDEAFYVDGGGVTLSGGEPLLQIDKCVPLLKELNERGISIAVETSLFVSENAVITALEYADWWYIDMKVLVPELCKDILGGDAGVYEQNLKLVLSCAKNVCIRIPCIHGIIDVPENINHITRIIKENGAKNIELIEGHNLGEKKYNSLNISNYYKSENNHEAVKSVHDALVRNGISHRVVRL